MQRAELRSRLLFRLNAGGRRPLAFAAGAVLALLALLTLLPSASHAQAVNYAGRSRVINVGKLIIDSSRYQSQTNFVQNGVTLNRATQAEDTAPYIFYLMNLRTDLKPRGWDLENPLAPTTVTQAIHDRWTAIEPPNLGTNSVVHNLRYTVGSPVSKDMAAYWEVNLNETPLSDLLKFDLLFISSHTPDEVFTPQEQEKLRKLVEAGGVVWVDDCWKFRISDQGRFFLPNLQFHGSHIGAQNPPAFAFIADRLHPLITTPYFLTQNDLNHLGDKNVGEYYHTGFVAPGVVNQNPPFNDTTPAVPPDLSQPEPDVLAPVIFNSSTRTLPGGPYPYVSAGRYGAGYVIVTSGDVGDAINSNCTGQTGFNIPGPDYDKNGGSVCGDATFASDPEDLKFAYNCLDWSSSFSTYRRGPEHSAYVPQSATLPLAREWQVFSGQTLNGEQQPLLAPGEVVESDPVLLRGRIFAPTSAGRLIALLQDPSLVPGSVGPVPIWTADTKTGKPASPITSVTVGIAANNQNGGLPQSLELLVFASGNQVFAFNSGYTQPTAPPWPSPNAVWASAPFVDTNGNPDPVNGAPVYMDGMLFVTTQSGGVYELNPADGTYTRNVAMPQNGDPNNTTDVLPPLELPLHFQNQKWNYMAASPAVGYVVDRSTSADDPTMVLSLYATASQVGQTNGAPHGGLLQFPIRVANEHYEVGQGTRLPDCNGTADSGPYLTHPLNYFAYKNPELVNFTVNGGSIAVVPLKATGAGTVRITISWPEPTSALSTSYYLLSNGGMAPDFGSGGASCTLPTGTWVFYKPQQPVKWYDGKNSQSRGLYNQIVLAPQQWWLNPATGNYEARDLTDDCEIHIDYDVDESDPYGTTGSGTAGPSFHPELAFLDFPPDRTVGSSPGVDLLSQSGSAILAPPAIGLDDSVYFGGEDGVLYSAAHWGARGLPINWKFSLNAMLGNGAWGDSNGNTINPVTLARSNDNTFTRDIHYVPASHWVVRSTPTTGNGRVFFTATDLVTNTTRVVGFDSLEFRTSVPPPSQNGANVVQAQGGVPVTFFINTDPNNAAVQARNAAQPVGMLAQFDPVTNQMHQFFPQADDFTVDPESGKVTLNRFGSMYSNLPIYVWYNLNNGQAHSFVTNPPAPPDEVHNVVPNLNVPVDANGRYLIPVEGGGYISGNAYANNGGPYPDYIFPSEQISNMIWQFPDPTWNPGVVWASTIVPQFTGSPISSAPLVPIGEPSPSLVGDTLFVGTGHLHTPGQAAGQYRSGLMALAADPRGGLNSYTNENVGIYDFTAAHPTPAGNVPPSIQVNNDGAIVTITVTQQQSQVPTASLLAPYPPAVTYFDTDDFQGAGPNVDMLATPPVTSGGAIVGWGTRGGRGGITMLGSPLTVALDSYRLVGLDAGGNIAFEVPSTTKTTLLGSDQPVEETDTTTSGGRYATTKVSFNRASTMQKVDQANVVIADTGNDRVVETDLGGNVISEVTKYYDPQAPYQPGDIYQVAPANGPVPAAFAVGNKHLTGPTDAFEWHDTETDSDPRGAAQTVLDTFRLIVDSGNAQVVLIVDKVFESGAFAGQFVPIPTQDNPLNNSADGLPRNPADPPITPVADPNGNPVRWYHVKAWSTQPSPSHILYRFRNVTPYLSPWYDANGTHYHLTAVFATVTNAGLSFDANGNVVEGPGSTLGVFWGIRDAAGNWYPEASQGQLKAAATELTPAPWQPQLTHPITNPVFLRLYFAQTPDQAQPTYHLAIIDQGARYGAVTGPNGPVAGGAWGAYDLEFGAGVTPDQLVGNFQPQIKGSLDDVSYALLTNPPDLFYQLGILPTYQPTSLEYLSLTNTMLVTNSSLNLLRDPTFPFVGPPDNPAAALGRGGEVLLVDANPFYGIGNGYVPDNAGGGAVPSILFRSIPVKGSYVLQQVMGADRTFSPQ